MSVGASSGRDSATSSVEAERGTGVSGVSGDVPDLLVGAALPRATAADSASGVETGEFALNARGIVNPVRLWPCRDATAHEPDASWSAVRRTQVEDELTQNSTPMYRAPEMLDTWYQNASIGTASGVWLLRCILYTLCFKRHPFEDSVKLKIINANYIIPPADRDFVVFHELLSKSFSLCAVFIGWPKCP